MSTLLEKALEKLGALPRDEQDAMASQIFASLADEDAWKKRFVEKLEIIRRMARLGRPSRKTQGVKRCRSTSCFDPVADHLAVLALVLRSASGCSAGNQARISSLSDQP